MVEQKGDTAVADGGDDARRHRLRQGFGGQLVLLGLQFLLGMSVNLWVTIPQHHPGAAARHYFAGLAAALPWALTHGAALLVAHVVASGVIWLVASGLIVAAGRLSDRTLATLAVVGWTGVTGAAFNGGSFLNYGHNLSSFLMAVGFAVAVGGYVWAWGSAARPPRPLPRERRHG